MTDINSLSHTKWNCKYHIVFCPKYRRKEIYGKIKVDIGKILRKLCEMKNVEIIEANACKDHIHIYVKIPPNVNIAYFMGYLKGKSTFSILSSCFTHKNMHLQKSLTFGVHIKSARHLSYLNREV